MKVWEQTSEQKPPMGLKVLCHNGHGDFYVAQRLREFWFEHLKAKSALIETEEPFQWSYIEFPEPFEGRMHVVVDSKAFTMDDLDLEHPDVMTDLIENLKIGLKKLNKKKF